MVGPLFQTTQTQMLVRFEMCSFTVPKNGGIKNNKHNSLQKVLKKTGNN
jgi:hypothetical protein